MLVQLRCEKTALDTSLAHTGRELEVESLRAGYHRILQSLLEEVKMAEPALRRHRSLFMVDSPTLVGKIYCATANRLQPK